MTMTYSITILIFFKKFKLYYIHITLMTGFSVDYSTGEPFMSHEDNSCYSSTAGVNSCSCRFDLPQKVQTTRKRRQVLICKN